MVITVSLDLDQDNTGENKAIQALKKCSSDSRFQQGPVGPIEACQAVLERRHGSNLA